MLQEAGLLVEVEGSESVVHVVKLITLLYRKNNEGQFVEQLAKDMQMYMSFDKVAGCEEYLAQLVKFVYFGGLYDCGIKDLLQDVSKLQQEEDLMKELMGSSGGELSELLSFLN